VRFGVNKPDSGSLGLFKVLLEALFSAMFLQQGVAFFSLRALNKI
jgi:hypothetical protein